MAEYGPQSVARRHGLSAELVHFELEHSGELRASGSGGHLKHDLAAGMLALQPFLGLSDLLQRISRLHERSYLAGINEAADRCKLRRIHQPPGTSSFTQSASKPSPPNRIAGWKFR